MSLDENEKVRAAVRENYARVALLGAGGGCCAGGGCGPAPDTVGQALGYSSEELAAAPEGANLGLGCGNPQAIAALEPGEVVLDLGSGAGFDAFLAARAVGSEGRVIGVDMTPEMLARARENAHKSGLANVEFREGRIEALPVEDESVDVIISNCVINLSPDKAQVFREAARVLKPGGRLAVSDVVASGELSAEARADLALVSACIGGAASVAELTALMTAAGFAEIRIAPKESSREFIADWVPGSGLEAQVVSATIEAVKPRPAPIEAPQPPLHSVIVAMVSLAAGIAAKHPAMGLCQLAKLRDYGVPQHQIDTVIEIARHIRDEAAREIDAAFDEKSAPAAVPKEPPQKPKVPKGKPLGIAVTEAPGGCCSTTPSGQACC